MGHREAFGDYELLERAASRLLELDDLAAQGCMDAVEYELTWGEVYRELEVETKEKNSFRR